MEKIASCQIAFTPIMSDNYIKDIDKVLDIIKSSELEYNIGILSTTIRGKKDKILNLISNIYNTMDGICSFTMDIKISNICGCKQ
jgi:uncharacterized protein YqgV (UPF0045/DUF77 family)